MGLSADPRHDAHQHDNCNENSCPHDGKPSFFQATAPCRSEGALQPVSLASLSPAPAAGNCTAVAVGSTSDCHFVVDNERTKGATKALFMTVWRPSTRSAEHSCGIRQG